jgi:hypothetical protein
MALKSQRAPTSTKSPALALVIPTGVDQDSTFDSRVANQVDSECKPSSAVSTLVCAQKKRGKKKLRTLLSCGPLLACGPNPKARCRASVALNTGYPLADMLINNSAVGG